MLAVDQEEMGGQCVPKAWEQRGLSWNQLDCNGSAQSIILPHLKHPHTIPLTKDLLFSPSLSAPNLILHSLFFTSPWYVVYIYIREVPIPIFASLYKGLTLSLADNEY